jgi:hypothetical protein
MCRMNHIHVNADLKVPSCLNYYFLTNKTVTVQSGARWIDVLQATFPSIVVGPYDSSLGMGKRAFFLNPHLFRSDSGRRFWTAH